MNTTRYSISPSLFATCLLVFFTLPQSALSTEDHHHHDHAMEVGVSAAYVYLDAEDESAPGLHLHLVRRLEGNSFLQNFSVGLGFESIFADHTHYGLLGSVGIFPWRSLAITLSPGVVFADHDGEWETEYATHIEASYGFMIGEYEIGPVIGYADSVDDQHYMIGIHFGKGF